MKSKRSKYRLSPEGPISKYVLFQKEKNKEKKVIKEIIQFFLRIKKLILYPVL